MSGHNYNVIYQLSSIVSHCVYITVQLSESQTRFTESLNLPVNYRAVNLN